MHPTRIRVYRMKTTENIKILAMTFLVAIMGVGSFTSCGRDEDDDFKNESNWISDDNSNDTGGNSGNSNDGNSENTITQYDISSNVTVNIKSIFEGYGYEVNIISNLQRKYPNKTFKYGVVCGYDGYDYIKYYTAADKIVEYECVFIDADGVKYGWYGSMYWRSLVALKNKEDAGETLCEDEKDLQRDVMEIFRKDGYYNKTHYKGKIFVEYNDKRYYIKSFGNN